MTTSIKTKLTISNKNMDDWVPTTEVVGEKSFIKLSPWDRSFFRFCTGQSLVIGKGRTCPKSMFMKNLYDARNAASVKSWEDFNANMIANEENDQQQRRKRRKLRAPKESDCEICGREVSVIATHGSATMPMTCLFGCKKAEVWVEASEAVLDFIAMAVSSDIRNSNLDTSGTWARLRPAAADSSEVDQHDPNAGPSDPNANPSREAAPTDGSSVPATPAASAPPAPGPTTEATSDPSRSSRRNSRYVFRCRCNSRRNSRRNSMRPRTMIEPVPCR